MVWNKNTPVDKLRLEDFHGSPRISSWIPRHAEVARIAEYARVLDRSRILDAGCGNGLASLLFVHEGLFVLGVDLVLSEDVVDSQNRPSNLEFSSKDLSNGDLYRKTNVVFNSWMSPGDDMSGYFKYSKPRPKLIIYVKSRATGMQPGMPGNPNNVDSYKPTAEYIELDKWKCFGHDDFRSMTEPVILSKVGEVIVHARKDFYEGHEDMFKKAKSCKITVPEYNWEKQLPKI